MNIRTVTWIIGVTSLCESMMTLLFLTPPLDCCGLLSCGGVKHCLDGGSAFAMAVASLIYWR
jgi:hypothetical protein